MKRPMLTKSGLPDRRQTVSAERMRKRHADPEYKAKMAKLWADFRAFREGT